MTDTDRLDIMNVISLYSHVVDDGDLDRLEEIFTPDAVLAPTLTKPWTGLEEIRHYFSQFVPNQPIPTIAHHMTNPWVEVSADGRTAVARSKTIGIRKDMGFVTGEYRDEFVKTDKGWRISRRAIIRRTRFSTDPAESEN